MFTAETWPIACKMAFGEKTLTGEPIGEAGPKAWAFQLSQVQANGFDCIDPTDVWVPFWEFDDKRLAEFEKVVEDHGQRLASLSMGRRSVADRERGEEYLAIAHRFVDLADKFGSQVVNIGYFGDLLPAQQKALWFWHEDGFVSDPETRDLAISRTQELADHADRLGVRISLEMYEDSFCGSPEEAISMVKDIDRPNVGLNPDIGNLVRLHRPMPSGLEMYKQVLPYTNFWHIKNYLRDEDLATGAYFTFPSPLETGIIDYRTVIQLALIDGFDGVFMAEHYGGDWLGVEAQNMRYIREVLRQVEPLIPSTN